MLVTAGKAGKAEAHHQLLIGVGAIHLHQDKSWVIPKASISPGSIQHQVQESVEEQRIWQSEGAQKLETGAAI